MGSALPGMQPVCKPGRGRPSGHLCSCLLPDGNLPVDLRRRPKSREDFDKAKRCTAPDSNARIIDRFILCSEETAIPRSFLVNVRRNIGRNYTASFREEIRPMQKSTDKVLTRFGMPVLGSAMEYLFTECPSWRNSVLRPNLRSSVSTSSVLKSRVLRMVVIAVCNTFPQILTPGVLENLNCEALTSLGTPLFFSSPDLKRPHSSESRGRFYEVVTGLYVVYHDYGSSFLLTFYAFASRKTFRPGIIPCSSITTLFVICGVHSAMAAWKTDPIFSILQRSASISSRAGRNCAAQSI